MIPTYHRSDLFPRSRRWHKPLALGLPVVVLVIVAVKYISEAMK